MNFKEFYKEWSEFAALLEKDTIEFKLEEKFELVDEDFDSLEEKELITEKERTRLDRAKTRAMKAALKLATKGKFDTWDLRKQAAWRAKFEFKQLSPTKGRFIKRKKPLNPAILFKQMRKKSKRFKKLLKTRGKQIQKKALRKRGK